ncbi:alpha/beta-hydrolase [Teratosphaeria nubilosa]|uniref:Alpha/beta-hydrolase n=1 Tax=Teratosphaeria nubilosa TaxID=161662 RepID=A0A6G1LCA8_9PEZI|nr:alpha/beta-hydrolase [Teratosphaeria nubilosa]
MLSYIRNKVFATLIRYRTGAVASSKDSHQDEVLQIPSRDPSRTIKINVYHPTNRSKPTPVLINMHGSGFVIPNHGSDDAFCQRMRNDAGITVLDADYRKAPEHPFPAAPDDVEDVVKYVLSRPEKYDVNHISISGFSAGANLALSASGVIFPPGTFRSVLAFYPPTDIYRDRYAPESKAPGGEGSIPAWVSASFNNCYAPPPLDRKMSKMSPLYAEGERFPDRTLIVTCARDELCNEGEELAEKIRVAKAGGRVVQRTVPFEHAWDKRVKTGPEERRVRDEMYGLAVEML